MTENDVVTDCRINTKEASDYATFGISDDPIKAKITLTSVALRDIFAELVWLNTQFFTLHCNATGLLFKAQTEHGTLDITLPFNSPAIIEQPGTDIEPFSFSYNCLHFAKIAKHLANTESSCIRVNAKGLLSLRVKFKSQGNDGSDKSKQCELLLVPRVAGSSAYADDEEDESMQDAPPAQQAPQNNNDDDNNGDDDMVVE